ncbi:MAG: PorV/PorQ family protein [candidate division WOR-3 bacterium]
MSNIKTRRKNKISHQWVVKEKLNKKTIKLFTYIFIFLFLLNTASAGQYPGAVFLMIWPGSRPTGLAGAFSAIADDASATYYNPGGLGLLNSSYATIMHSPWLPGLYAGMSYDFLAFAYRLKNQGTVAGNIIYINTGETQVVNEQGQELGEYTTFDFAISGSYGFKATQNVGIGFSAKFIYSFLVPDWVWQAMPELQITTGGTGVSWAFDAGVLYKPWHYLSVGTSISNIGPGISYTSTGEPDPLPRMLRIGIKYTPLHTQTVNLNITPEITKVLVGMFYDETGTKSFWQKLNYEIWEAWKSFGIEAEFYNLVMLRLGYFEDMSGQRGGILVNRGNTTEHITLTDYLFSKDRGKFAGKVGLTFGIGIQFKGFQFDVSNDQLIYDFETKNYKFSLSYRF